MNIFSYKKKDGTTSYYFRAYIGTDERGKKIQTTRRGFKSKQEAMLAYTEFMKNQNRPESEQTFRSLFDMWSPLYEKTVRESTAKKTLSLYDNHILPYFGDFKLSRITKGICQNFIVEMSEKFSDTKNIKQALGLIFNYALNNEMISKNPMQQIKIIKKEEIREFENYLDREEFRSFIEALKTHASPLWRAFFYLIAFTGIRRGEALALSWNDIDIASKTLTVNKNYSKCYVGGKITPPKTKSSNRTIYISDDVINELVIYENYLKQENKYNIDIVFPNTDGTYITFSQPTRQLNSIIKRAKLNHITPHGLRHTHCCLLFEAGASIAQVQHRLGHSDVKMTLEVYNHVTKAKVSEVADIFVKYVGV